MLLSKLGCRCLKGHPLYAIPRRTGAEDLSFYYTRLLYCPDQMLAVMLFSHYGVLSCKIVRPRSLCGARCMGHAIKTWSAVCSVPPHSQFGKGARPHLSMDEWNRSTPVGKQLNLTRTVWGKLIPTCLALVLDRKTRMYSRSTLRFVCRKTTSVDEHSEARMLSQEKLFSRFRADGTNRSLDLSLFWRASECPLKKLYRI